MNSSPSSPSKADLLVVAPIVPEFDRAAGYLRLYLLLQMLARRYRVIFLSRIPAEGPQDPRYIRALEEAGIEVHVAVQPDVTELVGRVGLGVIFEFFTTAEGALGRVRSHRPDLPVVVDSVDIHFVRERRGAQYATRSWLAKAKAEMTKRRELRIYRRADLIITVTETDRAEILRELPDARVAIVPTVHGVSDSVPGFEERKPNSMLFVGGFAHRPNVDAVLFFHREVLPLVRRALPQVEVTIVGDHPPAEIADLQGEGFVVAGWVPEIAPYLDSHCVSIAPLRFGAGIKGKVGEALAAGLPVVTTSVGAEGMDLEHGRTAMIGDSPAALAEALVQICTDPILHRRLSHEGQAHVRRRWDLESVEQRLVEVVESLRGLRPKSMSTGDRIADLSRDAYLRSGLGRKIERLGSVATWYASRMSQAFKRQ